MKLAILLVIVIAVVIFSTQNSAGVAVNFLNYYFQESLALIVIASFILGILSGVIYMLPMVFKSSREISALRKELQAGSLPGRKTAGDSGMPQVDPDKQTGA